MRVHRIALAAIVGSLFLLAVLPAPTAYWAGADAWSPSFLLLSNWVNDSVLVYTGVPIANASFDGLRNYPPSMTNFYLGPYGIIPINLTFDGPYSQEAFLTLNNTVVSEGAYGTLEFMTPPATPYVVVIGRLSAAYNFTLSGSGNWSVVNEHVAVLRVSRSNFTVTVTLCSNVSIVGARGGLAVISPPGGLYLVISLGSTCPGSISSLISLNAQRVSQWLARSREPKRLPPQLASEYFLSLLVIKDDQNPYLGTFAASPSPLYLHTWVRDSAFAAMALQAAGHYGSALKYWEWMAHAQRHGKTWYTRYDFYTGLPDESYAIPELDSLGLFEIGVYEYYLFTHNVTLLDAMAGALNETVSFQVSSIESSPLHLIPEDLSVWEDRSAYHFWTEAVNLLGLYDAREALGITGYNVTPIEMSASELNQSIFKYFWNGSAFYSALVPYVVFTQTGRELLPQPEAPYVSSSSILPLAMGPALWPANAASTDVSSVLRGLWNQECGGLARFSGDTYHYNSYLYDSSEPEPPWTLTTMFLAYYYAVEGNTTGAEALLSWAVAHSQHGLLPEAVDPRYGNPLPTTSPLTWSSAIYVLTVLALARGGGTVNGVFVVAGVVAAVLIVTYALQRVGVRRLRRLEDSSQGPP